MNKEIEAALKNLDIAVSMVSLKRVEHNELINNLNNIHKYITELEAHNPKQDVAEDAQVIEPVEVK